MKTYAMPAKTTIKHEGCFKNAEVVRSPSIGRLVIFKPEKGYRDLEFIVSERDGITHVVMDSLVEAILVSDLTMIGIIKTLYSDRVVEKLEKRVVPFSVLHEICDAIVARKVDTRAKNRAKTINSLTENSYMLRVQSFPIDKIKASISMTADAIGNASANDEQRVRLLIHNLIADLQKHIGE